MSTRRTHAQRRCAVVVRRVEGQMRLWLVVVPHLRAALGATDAGGGTGYARARSPRRIRELNNFVVAYGGMELHRVRELPVETYVAESSGATECSVCLEEFQAASALLRLPCGHHFHPGSPICCHHHVKSLSHPRSHPSPPPRHLSEVPVGSTGEGLCISVYPTRAALFLPLSVLSPPARRPKQLHRSGEYLLCVRQRALRCQRIPGRGTVRGGRPAA